MKRALLVLTLMLPARLATADDISGPPPCPPGSRGASAHEGVWCEPWPCESDSACEGGRCVPWRVCTRVASVVPGGLRPTEPPPEARTLVVGSCDPARACTGTEEPPPPTVGSFDGAAPATCTEARYCVPVALPPFPGRAQRGASAPETSAPEAPSPPTSARNCGCRAMPASMHGGAIAIALLALVLRRRR